MSLPRSKLSKRMLLFIEHALLHQPFWDICCDHGYVGIGALSLQNFTEVHFVDRVPHIMERLNQLIESANDSFGICPYFLHTIDAQNLSEVVTGTCLIAGVGGLTIVNILKSLLNNQKLNAQRLLLSPQTDELVLVEFIESLEFKNKYLLTNKILVSEGKRTRSIYKLDLLS